MMGKGRDKSHIQCHRCKQMGHYKSEKVWPLCGKDEADAKGLWQLIPEQDDGVGGDGAVQLTIVGIALAAKVNRSIISKDWILLDNQDNRDVFMNPRTSHRDL
jgi:hypothetical protein